MGIGLNLTFVILELAYEHDTGKNRTLRKLMPMLDPNSTSVKRGHSSQMSANLH